MACEFCGEISLDVLASVDPVDFRLLATAIRNGDKADAEALLDKIAECDAALPEMVSQGRFCSATRKAA